MKKVQLQFEPTHEGIKKAIEKLQQYDEKLKIKEGGYDFWDPEVN